MIPFELVTEFGRPVAALVSTEISHQQLVSLFLLLPEDSANQVKLASRWNLHLVLADPEWTRQQLKRVPMLKPKQTLKLAFVQ